PVAHYVYQYRTYSQFVPQHTATAYFIAQVTLQLNLPQLRSEYLRGRRRLKAGRPTRLGFVSRMSRHRACRPPRFLFRLSIAWKKSRAPNSSHRILTYRPHCDVISRAASAYRPFIWS